MYESEKGTERISKEAKINGLEDKDRVVQGTGKDGEVC